MAEEKPAFKISILASGSSGNSLYIESEKKRLLVDAGLSGKKITSLMAQIDRTPDQLDGILVTHEHRDHIHGVGVLARKYHLDVFANQQTWEAMEPLIGNVPVEQKHLFEMGKVRTFGDIDIESFGVSHDAAAPQFYRFHKENRSFVRTSFPKRNALRVSRLCCRTNRASNNQSCGCNSRKPVPKIRTAAARHWDPFWLRGLYPSM